MNCYSTNTDGERVETVMFKGTRNVKTLQQLFIAKERERERDNLNDKQVNIDKLRESTLSNS